MMAGPVLIVPACEKGRGGGHLYRSVFLLRKLGEQGRDACLWIPGEHLNDVIQRFKDLFSESDSWLSSILSRSEQLDGLIWDFIVLDRFKTLPDEFAFWANLSGQAPLIGIDEGGPCRDSFDFLIDLLPSLSKHKPNLSVPGFLPLPKNRRTIESLKVPDTNPLRILISFGAEDSARLGHSVARLLSSNSSLIDVTLIEPDSGSIGKNANELPGVKVIGKIPDLRERLAEYDLLITHFGIGAFEAVYARVPVLLFSPTACHEKLGRSAGFLTANLKDKIGDSNLFEALKARGREIARRFGLEEDQKEDLASFMGSIAPNSKRSCPVCERNAGSALARFPESTYCRCPQCGTIYQSRIKPPPIEYEKDYFFDSYKKQYGKTYLEDFPNLKQAGLKRLERIKAISHSSFLIPHSSFLLDIGCAYGPFLAAAAESGFSPHGVEPAEDAVRYIKEELGLTAWHGFFPDAIPVVDNIPGRYDVITLWYVIEHFEDPGKIFMAINRLLKDGGVLAFSTPSFSGISGRKSLGTFLKNSPSDHWTIWNPKLCKKIFRQYGFRLRKIVITGHHPERFPILGSFVRARNKNLLYRLLLLISRLFRLGDTFEAYGEKVFHIIDS